MPPNWAARLESGCATWPGLGFLHRSTTLRRGLVLVTRPRDEADRTVATLRRRGLRAIATPVLRVELLPGQPPEAHPGVNPGTEAPDAIVLTSGNAVRGLSASGGLSPTLTGITAIAVGDRTAALAKQAGFTKTLSAQGNSHDLLRLCTTHLKPYSRILHVTGEGLGLTLGQALSDRRFQVSRWESYRTTPIDRFDPQTRWILGRHRASGVLLLSPRSAASFAQLLGKHRLWSAASAMIIACISRATADTLLDSAGPKPLWTVCIAQKPDLTGTIDALFNGKYGGKRPAEQRIITLG